MLEEWTPGWDTKQSLIYETQKECSIAFLRYYLFSLQVLPSRRCIHIPQKYMDVHGKLPFWKDSQMAALAGPLLHETPEIMADYN